jgi:hypothetical protein
VTPPEAPAVEPARRGWLWPAAELVACAALGLAWLALPTPASLSVLGASDAPADNSAGVSSPEPTYGGGAACASCHEREHRAWQGSHHDRAMAEATESPVLGDFSGVTFQHAGVTSSFFRAARRSVHRRLVFRQPNVRQGRDLFRLPRPAQRQGPCTGQRSLRPVPRTCPV